jgi:hypothetical protein
MKKKEFSLLPILFPTLLLLLTVLSLFFFLIIENNFNSESEKEQDTKMLQEPYGWKWISTESTSFARTIRAKDFQLLVPTQRTRIMFQGYLDNLPQQGIVIRSGAPVWSDPNATQLITRLTRGESVRILNREPWRAQSSGVIHNFLIEDQLGNRGYVGSDVLMFPIQQVGNFLLGKIEMIETIPSFNPPFFSNQRIGSVITLPVIQTPQDFFVLVPDSLNQDSLLLESQNELVSVAILPTEISNQLEFLVFYGRNETYNEVKKDEESKFHILGLSAGAFRTGDITFYSESLSLKSGHVVNASLPFRAPYLPSTRSTIPLASSGVQANHFEFVSTWNNALVVHQLFQLTPDQPDTRSIYIPVSFPRTQSQRVTENNVALRTEPSQGAPLMRRIERDTEVLVVGIHLPSTVILNSRYFWLQVEVLGQDEELFGWVWGEFIQPSQ